VARSAALALGQVFSETKTLTRLHSHDNGDVEVGFGRLAVSEIEAPNILVNLV
jgi:hypothetical protein